MLRVRQRTCDNTAPPMTDLRKAAQQALETLKSAAISVDSFRGQKATQDAITALKAALEQQAEPVATYHPCTLILIQGLKKLKAWDVLAEWDRAREIVDERFQAGRTQQQVEPVYRKNCVECNRAKQVQEADDEWKADLVKGREILARQLAEQPEQQAESEPVDLPDVIARALGVSRGTAYGIMRQTLEDLYGKNNADVGVINVLKAALEQQADPTPPDDESICADWITASDTDGIEYDGPSFERGYKMGQIDKRDAEEDGND